jgi:hypothetical protein
MESIKKLCAEMEAERDAVLNRLEAEAVRKVSERAEGQGLS